MTYKNMSLSRLIRELINSLIKLARLSEEDEGRAAAETDVDAIQAAIDEKTTAAATPAKSGSLSLRRLTLGLFISGVVLLGLRILFGMFGDVNIFGLVEGNFNTAAGIVALATCIVGGFKAARGTPDSMFTAVACFALTIVICMMMIQRQNYNELKSRVVEINGSYVTWQYVDTTFQQKGNYVQVTPPAKADSAKVTEPSKPPLTDREVVAGEKAKAQADSVAKAKTTTQPAPPAKDKTFF